MCNSIYEKPHFPFDKVAITIFAVGRRRNIRAARRRGRPAGPASAVCFPDHKKSHNIDCCVSGDTNTHFCFHF